MPELSAQPLPKDRRDARRGPMDQTLERDLNGMNLSHSVAGHRGDIPLTIFTVPKAFDGHVGLIQRNAITSWKRLRPACQVIMCGDEAGCERIAAELGIDWIPAVDCNEFGTPLLSSVFALAEAMAESDLLCYANADIILPSSFLDATTRVLRGSKAFLAVGRSWDCNLIEELPADGLIESTDLLRRYGGVVRPANSIDYFLFPRCSIRPIPPFAVGRPAWDNWMIYRARKLGIPVIDASPSTIVIHQTHDYRHVKHATGEKWQGPEARQNLALLGIPKRNRFSLDDATHLLTPTGLTRSPGANEFRRRLRTKLLLTDAFVPVYLVMRSVYRALRGAFLSAKASP